MTERQGICVRCESVDRKVYRTYPRGGIAPLTLCSMCCWSMRLRPVRTKEESMRAGQALLEFVYASEIEALEAKCD